MPEDELFERWQSLDAEVRNGIFPSLFGRMRHLKLRGTLVAEGFFMEVESLITNAERRLSK